MDEDFSRRLQDNDNEGHSTSSSVSFSIDLRRIQTLAQSRSLHNEDKPSADLIQHYGLSAVRCFEMGENPTLALMALMPFKLSEFSLGQEIYQLLFSPPAIEKKSTQSTEQITKELTAFVNRLDEILASIVKFHNNPANDPYLIQTAMSLQMLVVAAMMKASSVNPTYEATVGRQLLHKLSTLHLHRINNKKYQDSIIYPAEKFLAPSKTQPEIFYTLTLYNPYASATKPATTVGAQQKTDPLDILHEFNSAFDLAEKNQFDAALTMIETTLQKAEVSGVGNFISGYVSYVNSDSRYVELGTFSNDLSLIFDYLSKEDIFPEKQEFALAVLSKTLEKTYSSEINDLLTLDRGKQFLNILLTLKPKSPRATLLLAEIFEALVNKAPKMSYPHKGEKAKPNPSLLALYLSTQETTSLSRSRKTATFIIAGTLLLFGAITLILAITTFPLLPLYIVGGVLAALGISAGVGGLTISEPVKKEMPSNGPMIQESLFKWTRTYGYDGSLSYELLQLFENSPELVHAIDVERDFLILRPIVQNETWDTIIPQLKKIFREDQSKIVELLVQRDDIFKTVVTHIDQLKQLSDWITQSWLDDTKKKALKDDMSNIISQDGGYLNTLIARGCATVTTTTLPSHREIGATIGHVQITSTESPDAYKMLLSIFKGDERMEELIKSKQTTAQAAAQNPFFGEVPPAKQIVKTPKTPSSEVKNEKTDTTPKPGE